MLEPTPKVPAAQALREAFTAFSDDFFALSRLLFPKADIFSPMALLALESFTTFWLVAPLKIEPLSQKYPEPSASRAKAGAPLAIDKTKSEKNKQFFIEVVFTTVGNPTLINLSFGRSGGITRLNTPFLISATFGSERKFYLSGKNKLYGC